MAKTGPNCPQHTPNGTRTVAKFKRGFGQDAMKKAKMDHVEWTRKYDPLYKVKGKERHRLLYGI